MTEPDPDLAGDWYSPGEEFESGEARAPDRDPAGYSPAWEEEQRIKKERHQRLLEQSGFARVSIAGWVCLSRGLEFQCLSLSVCQFFSFSRPKD